MNYELIAILAYLIAVPAIIGLFRINRIDPAYYPFIVLLWIGLFNEIINTYCIEVYRSNVINSNIYVLVEALLILYFFRRLELFNKTYQFYLFLLLFAGTWVAEHFVFFSIWSFNSYFRILYSFTIVLMSISMINRLISSSSGRLIRNSAFLIMIGFIFFFTYKVLIEIFYIYSIEGSEVFGVQVYRLITYINLSVNLLYAIAIIWIPRKREYTLPS